jgi:hypothetical protein
LVQCVLPEPGGGPASAGAQHRPAAPVSEPTCRGEGWLGEVVGLARGIRSGWKQAGLLCSRCPKPAAWPGKGCLLPLLWLFLHQEIRLPEKFP